MSLLDVIDFNSKPEADPKDWETDELETDEPERDYVMRRMPLGNPNLGATEPGLNLQDMVDLVEELNRGGRGISDQ
jgi:hypothetical protein